MKKIVLCRKRELGVVFVSCVFFFMIIMGVVGFVITSARL